MRIGSRQFFLPSQMWRDRKGQEGIVIRQTTDADNEAVQLVQESAFGQKDEASLTLFLLADPSAAPLLSLLALIEERPLGHILFTRVGIKGNESITASILAPMAVVPDAQGRGVGGELIRYGLWHLKDRNTDLVFVLGHPGYYPRFGFHPAGEQGLQAPYPIPPEHAEAWMVQELKTGILGSVQGVITCADTLSKAEYWVE